MLLADGTAMAQALRETASHPMLEAAMHEDSDSAPRLGGVVSLAAQADRGIRTVGLARATVKWRRSAARITRQQAPSRVDQDLTHHSNDQEGETRETSLAKNHWRREW